jgi:hypothetical protein
MPKYLPMRVIRSMSYEELARWWEVDFDALTSTAVAEATGPVMPSVAEALRSEDWMEQWADALYAASGELATSVERMEYRLDERLETTRRRSGQVNQRMAHVNALLREARLEQAVADMPDHMKDAYRVCVGILANYYKQEGRELANAEIARRGLASHHPFWNATYETKFDAITDAVNRGMLHAPVTPQVVKLSRLPAHALTQVVAADVTRQEDRCAELRHPLLLGRWLESLEHLRDRHCELAGIEPSFTVTLPSVDLGELHTMPREAALSILNRRRFIRALAQRRRECGMHIREITRVVAIRRAEIEQPWHDAVEASRQQLGRRHPEQLEALLSAFGPFCEPGTLRIRSDMQRTGGPVRGRLIPTLKKALADGSWRNLLDTAA